MSWLALSVRLGVFALQAIGADKFLQCGSLSLAAFYYDASPQVIIDLGFAPTFSREIAYGFAGRSLAGLQDPRALPSTAAADAPRP